MTKENVERLAIADLPTKDLEIWNQKIAIALEVMREVNGGVLDEDTPDAKRILAQREEIATEIANRNKPATEGWRSELLTFETPNFPIGNGEMVNELIARGWVVTGVPRSKGSWGGFINVRSVLISRDLERRQPDK